jgi:endoglycosylceramidase
MEWQLEYFNNADVKAAFDRFWASGSAVQTEYLAAWDVMLARFKDQPGVVGFEPMNEPGWGSQDSAQFEATTLSAFYARVVPHFRQLAPQGLVFVEPTGFAGSIVSSQLQQPSLGDGVVFAPHYYPIATPKPEAVLMGLQPWADVGAQWKVPVLLGEFGMNHDRDTIVDVVTADFAALDALGMGGTEWEYSVTTTVWNNEQFSLVGSDGTEYPVVGALARPFARAVAGDSIAQAWDAATSTFTLSYAPAGSSAVTEVSVPGRVYPSAPHVALSGGCYDATSQPGRVLVQADSGATQVSLTIRP